MVEVVGHRCKQSLKGREQMKEDRPGFYALRRNS